MKTLKNVFCLFALLPVIVAAQPAWLNDGLVAYYPFDGDAKDYSGNGNDGEITISAPISTKNRFGSIESAYDFTNSRSPISIPSSESFNFRKKPFTISMWLTSENVNDGYVLSKYKVGENNSFGIAVRGNGIVYNFVVSEQPGLAVVSPPTELGSEWGMLTVSVETQQLTVFVNGKIVVQGSIEAEEHTIDNQIPLMIGGLPNQVQP